MEKKKKKKQTLRKFTLPMKKSLALYVANTSYCAKVKKKLKIMMTFLIEFLKVPRGKASNTLGILFLRNVVNPANTKSKSTKNVKISLFFLIPSKIIS